MVDIGRRESSTLDTMRNLLRSIPQRSFSRAVAHSAEAHSVWHPHKIQTLLRWITRRGFLQCKYAFLVCQPGIKSTCGGGQHKTILGWTALYCDTKMDCLVPAVDSGRRHNTLTSVFRDIQWLFDSVGPIVVVIVDSVPILLLIMKSAQ